MKEKVLLGMSGGVDSSVAALLLQKQGYEVVGITMNFCNNDDEFANDAKKICQELNIEHIVIDLRDAFRKKVISNFIESYKKCLTPNPCIECNKFLKFEYMYKKATELGINYIASGHYANAEWSEKYSRKVITKSNSGNKDQTYVLYSIPKEILEHIIFPLAEFSSKEEIRKIAYENKLIVADKPDSQDICFIPDNDYKKFLKDNSDLKSLQGKIVNKNGEVLGTHDGLHKYTIGQRKGLGIANPVPLYVLGFRKEKNELIVGTEEELYTNIVYAENVNLQAIDDIAEPIPVYAKIRYASKMSKAILTKKDNRIKLVFDEPQRGVTPGQSVVFYDENILLGGGKII